MKCTILDHGHGLNPIGSNLGCVVLLPKLYLNEKYLSFVNKVEYQQCQCEQLTLKVLVATIDALGHFETG